MLGWIPTYQSFLGSCRQVLDAHLGWQLRQPTHWKPEAQPSMSVVETLVHPAQHMCNSCAIAWEVSQTRPAYAYGIVMSWRYILLRVLRTWDEAQRNCVLVSRVCYRYLGT